MTRVFQYDHSTGNVTNYPLKKWYEHVAISQKAMVLKACQRTLEQHALISYISRCGRVGNLILPTHKSMKQIQPFVLNCRKYRNTDRRCRLQFNSSRCVFPLRACSGKSFGVRPNSKYTNQLARNGSSRGSTWRVLKVYRPDMHQDPLNPTLISLSFVARNQSGSPIECRSCIQSTSVTQPLFRSLVPPALPPSSQQHGWLK